MIEDFSGLDGAPLERISNLAEFLRTKPRTLKETLFYLWTNTFYGRSAFGHILHVVRHDGTLEMPAWSGFKTWPIEKFPDRLVTADTPLNRSLRTSEIVECGSFESFAFAGPDYLNDLFPRGFEASIAWPIPGIGSVLSFFDDAVELTPELSTFLKTLGNVISLAPEKFQGSKALNLDGHPEHVISQANLTSRQWNILTSIRRGMTNPQIALDLEFSESLVRHETMKIYSELKVSGRKELIEMPDEIFPIVNR